MSNIGKAPLTPIIQVGTILIEDRPLVTRILDLESEPYSGNWSVVKDIDGLALDRKIHAAGWYFFYINRLARNGKWGVRAASLSSLSTAFHHIRQFLLNSQEASLP